MTELNIKQLRNYDLGGIFVPVYNEEFEQLIKIAETATKYAASRKVVYGTKSTHKDFRRMQELEDELSTLVANVELES